MDTKIQPQTAHNEVTSYLENVSLLVLGIFLLAFPLAFTTATTDPFTLPKQILLAGAVLVSLLLFGGKMISQGSVILRRTPFDLPVFLFTIFLLASSVFAVNRFDSLITFAPLLLAILAYFIIVNVVKNKSSIFFLLSCLIAGGSLISLITVLSFLKVYILPYAFTNYPSFTPFGSLLDQALYLAIITPLSSYFALPLLKGKSFKPKEGAFAVSTLLVAIGFFVTVYQLLTTQKPFILPFETGFQTAFAAISQDTGRVATGFFLGSGFGTYFTDFTRFKQAAFNLNQNIWSLSFFRSSSFVLELLATTGILGLLSYLFLVFKLFKDNGVAKKVKENFVFLSLIIAVIASFALPLTFTSQTILFILIGLFAATQGLKPSSNLKEAKFYDVELHFIAFKNGLIPLATMPVNEAGVAEEKYENVKEEEGSYTRILPVTFFVLFIAFTAVFGFYALRYIYSDIIFQNSLIAASANNGLATYNSQVNAIQIFPYRDAYHRIYSQTNLALANSLAAAQPKDSKPSDQVQQTIYTLIQQSINSARNAVTVSPLTVTNWQNLSSIYRSLIGFGQNAEQFAILTNQQSVILDPNNPQEYISLGGVYYQLGDFDNAQRQFQIAVNLKPDLANAYYNLGHALESKGDLQNALMQYQAVQTLVANDQNNLKTISAEIAAVQQKMGQAQQAAQQAEAEKQASEQKASPATVQQPLEVNEPETQLPEQNPQVEIPAPSEAPTATPTPSTVESESPEPSVNP